ncbi:MAG: tellurite resistance TerB family protein, partial [Pirellula sp.]
AVAGGLAALLLATKTGRKISGKLLAVGSVAAVGTLAYTAYQKWAQSQGKTTDENSDAPLATLTGVSADKRSQLILRAMLAAARADGVIDADEQRSLEQQLQRMDGAEDAKEWLRAEMLTPHDVDSIAKQVDSTAAAAEVYLVSKLIIDEASPVERAYLQQLEHKLKLDPGLVEQIMAQVRTATA